jgi:hypothetical protein
VGVKVTTTNCTNCAGAGTIPCSACGGARDHQVFVEERRNCPQCGGGDVNCPLCWGAGYVTDCVSRQESCAMCNGAGRFQCPQCQGNGTVTEAVYEPDTPAEALQAVVSSPPVPTDTLPHLSAATSDELRPDPVMDAVNAAEHEQLEYQGYLDPPIRRQEYTDYVVEARELGMEPLGWREWDRTAKFHAGMHGPHPVEEAGEGVAE